MGESENLASSAEYKLILDARNNDETAFETLYGIYLPTVKACVASFSPPTSEKDDLTQEGCIGLIRAIRTYDNRSSSFRTYASLCIKRNIISALRRYKKTAMTVCTAEIEVLADAAVPEYDYSECEEKRQNYARFTEKLSKFEKQTLSLYLTGMTYVEMAKKLSCSEKSVGNAMTRIKAKIKKQR